MQVLLPPTNPEMAGFSKCVGCDHEREVEMTVVTRTIWWRGKETAVADAILPLCRLCQKHLRLYLKLWDDCGESDKTVCVACSGQPFDDKRQIHYSPFPSNCNQLNLVCHGCQVPEETVDRLKILLKNINIHYSTHSIDFDSWNSSLILHKLRPVECDLFPSSDDNMDNMYTLKISIPNEPNGLMSLFGKGPLRLTLGINHTCDACVKLTYNRGSWEGVIKSVWVTDWPYGIRFATGDFCQLVFVMQPTQHVLVPIYADPTRWYPQPSDDPVSDPPPKRQGCQGCQDAQAKLKATQAKLKDTQATLQATLRATQDTLQDAQAMLQDAQVMLQDAQAMLKDV